MPVQGGTVWEVAAKARPVEVDPEQPAAVAPCRSWAPARNATPENQVEASATTDTPSEA